MKEVKVKWMDSCSGDNCWAFINDFQPFMPYPVTYGFVIYEDEEKVCIAQTYAKGHDDVPDQFNGTITIPKKAILETEYL